MIGLITIRIEFLLDGFGSDLRIQVKCSGLGLVKIEEVEAFFFFFLSKFIDKPKIPNQADRVGMKYIFLSFFFLVLLFSIKKKKKKS